MLLSAAEINNSTIAFIANSQVPACSLFIGSWGSNGGLFFFLVFVLVFWFNQSPLLFFLDCELKRSVGVASAVVTNAGVPPELVDREGAQNNIRVVKLVVVADPAADESPSGLNGGVSSETGDFLGFTA